MSAQTALDFTVPDVSRGTHPGFATSSDTSRDAAASILPTLAGRQAAVLEQLRQRGPSTGEEIADAMRRPTYVVLPRIRELALRGLVIDTGKRRTNRSGRSASVWAVK